MRYTKQIPETNTYSCLQDKPSSGCVSLDDQQVELFIQYNGFVTITENEDGTVTVTPNTEAWEAWKAEMAEQQVAAPLDPITQTQLAVAELSQIVEENNRANQLAIAELAEAMLGGEG